MKKFIIPFVIVLLVAFGIYFFYEKNQNNNLTGNYTADKTSTNSNPNEVASNSNNNQVSSESVNNEISPESSDNSNSPNTSDNKAPETPAPVEEEIASFSTKIVDKNANRQNNVQITCSTLNDTIVENTSTFSFCNTVGKATTDRGYKEADIFDANGNKVKGLGGGNCQISTTLYNAVLQIPELEIVERHKHSKYVPYIERGKDATVAYGSCDFRFKNNTGNRIKIKAEATENDVTIRLLKIS